MEENKDIKLLKGAFKDNSDLLKIIRKLLFGFETTEAEKGLIQVTFQSNELKEAFRKKIFAIFGDEVELGHIADFWQIPEDKIVGAEAGAMKQVIEMRTGVAVLFDKALALLDDPNTEPIDLSYDPAKDNELYTKLLVRNRYINAIEGALGGINSIANSKVPSMEDIQAKMKKDSSK